MCASNVIDTAKNNVELSEVILSLKVNCHCCSVLGQNADGEREYTTIEL